MRYPNVKLHRSTRNMGNSVIRQYEMIYNSSKFGKYIRGVNAGNEVFPALEHELYENNRKAQRYEQGVHNLAESKYRAKRPIVGGISISHSRRMESEYLWSCPIVNGRRDDRWYSRNQSNHSSNDNSPITPVRWALRTMTILEMNEAEIDQAGDMFDREYGDEE